MSGDLVSYSAVALPGIPLIKPGDDLVRVIVHALDAAEMMLQPGDLLVVSSKIVSKAEGRFVLLSDVNPGDEAHHYAQITGKDPRIVQLVLDESVEVSRAQRGVLVTEHRLGFVCANAGVDQSNVDNTGDRALLLPRNPDESARQIRAGLHDLSGVEPAVVISDTHGRPFRMGNIGVAIGVAGIPALVDWRGQDDLFGRTLAITTQGYADLVASAAHLLCGEGAEGRPVILLRGLPLPEGDGDATDLNRPREQDMYR